MYYIFIHFGILPGTYYNLPAGQKIVLRAFADYHEEANP